MFLSQSTLHFVWCRVRYACKTSSTQTRQSCYSGIGRASFFLLVYQLKILDLFQISRNLHHIEHGTTKAWYPSVLMSLVAVTGILLAANFPPRSEQSDSSIVSRLLFSVQLLHILLSLCNPLSNLFNVSLCKYVEIVRRSIYQCNDEYCPQIEGMQYEGMIKQRNHL